MRNGGGRSIMKPYREQKRRGVRGIHSNKE